MILQKKSKSSETTYLPQPINSNLQSKEWIMGICPQTKIEYLNSVREEAGNDRPKSDAALLRLWQKNLCTKSPADRLPAADVRWIQGAFLRTFALAEPTASFEGSGKNFNPPAILFSNKYSAMTLKIQGGVRPQGTLERLATREMYPYDRFNSLARCCKSNLRRIGLFFYFAKIVDGCVIGLRDCISHRFAVT